MGEIFVGFVTAVWLFLVIVFLTKLINRRIHESFEHFQMDQEIFHVEDLGHEESWAGFLEWFSNHGQTLELTGPQGGTQTRKYIRVHE